MNTLSYQIIQVLQGEGGTVESLLAHTASLTTTLAEKDQVIGEVIDNLNSVLHTLNERTPQLSQLISRSSGPVSGLASDREPIGEAISSSETSPTRPRACWRRRAGRCVRTSRPSATWPATSTTTRPW